MARSVIRLLLVVVLLGTAATSMGSTFARSPVAPLTMDLYIKDTPSDTGIEPNPDTGPMWITEDIWVRTTPDPNWQPQPFSEASPPWAPLPHQNPEYRDPKFSRPNYIYVRVRNRGGSASAGTERLRLYWAKASTGLSWSTQWVDYVVNSGGQDILYGAEVTKPRKNAATATQAERNAYVAAILKLGTTPALTFPDGVSYWHKQNEVHQFGPTNRHSTVAFLPWHREYINRYEVLLQEADPTVKLLYWDWTTNPTNSSGFNFFTSSFMGASGSGTGGTSIGAPFNPPSGPTLAPPSVVRGLGSDPRVPTPTSTTDSSLLGLGTYFNFSDTLEGSPHDRSHVYIGGTGGNISSIPTAAQDPFFFLLHANADRIWAQWQRASVSRLNPATTYGTSSGNANLTGSMRPWNGSGTSIRPWTVADGYIVSKTALDPSVVSPPIYDTAPLVIPALQPGQAVILQIPWYPPNPADFASFGADQGHFCLLARIETSSSAPFGMTFAEGNDVFLNTKDNNNIVWKNITVVNNFLGAFRFISIFVRNVFAEPVQTGLRFVESEKIGSSFFEFGRITVDLGPELFDRWVKGGAVGQGIERSGGTKLQIYTTDAFIGNIRLEAGEQFPVDVQFELNQDYKMTQGAIPEWDLIQTGTPRDPDGIVGGQRFNIDFSKLVLVPEGGEWRYLDDGSDQGAQWRQPEFDDSRWKQGRAELGFGSDPVTTIESGPADKRHITSYYRRSFEVTDPSFYRTLYLRLKRNDGAVVYLNGTEIHRVNLPAGEIRSDTPATQEVDGLEREIFFPVEADPGLLRQGKNVVAVEIHLASPTSQDLSFDLELYANPFDTRLAPDVVVDSPPYGALIQSGEEIPIHVEALDSDGKVTGVTFYINGELVGSDNEPPYIFRWRDAPLGAHNIQVRAVDEDQLQGVADTTITVVENRPPTVELMEPLDGIVVREGEPVAVSAQASDQGGNVSRVEFYLKRMELFTDPEKRVGVAESAPYRVSLTDIAPGHYMLYAVAVDSDGATSQSEPAHFEIHGAHTHLFLPLMPR